MQKRTGAWTKKILAALKKYSDCSQIYFEWCQNISVIAKYKRYSNGMVSKKSGQLHSYPDKEFM